MPGAIYRVLLPSKLETFKLVFCAGGVLSNVCIYPVCFVCLYLSLRTQLTTEYFGDIVGENVSPRDVFLAFTVDQGGNVVNACVLLGVAVIKCNAHRLNSATMWALGISGFVKKCENPAMEKLVKRPSAVVGVFSHSAVNNDELKKIQTLREDCEKVYELIRRNDTR